MVFTQHKILIIFGFLMFIASANINFAQAPQVIATVPAQNAVHVSPSVTIAATFDIAIDESTINDTTVIIHGSQTGTKTGTLVYYPNTKTVNFVPEVGFKSGEVVKVMLTDEIRTPAGVALENGFSWEFTIRTKRRELDYAPAINYDAGMFPSCLYAGDLDQDTDIDLAVAEAAAPGNLFIYLNSGEADFGIRRMFSGVYYPTHIIGVDLDGDGDLDLVTSNHDSDNSGFVVVWINKGEASFELSNYFGYAKDFGHSWVSSHDFDGDGDHDLAAAIGMADKVSLLFNNGDATFGSPVLYDVGTSPRSLVSADLDLDGDMDIAVANWGSNNVSILSNTTGQFSLMANYSVGNRPYGITAADFDGDGDADLATANWQSNNVSVLLNNGDGSFAAAIGYPVPSQPRRIMAADFDGDGDIDLATTNYGSNVVHLLCNNGSGEFTNGGNFSVGKDPESIQAADVDGDGDLDIITANADYSGTISVLLNDGAGPEPKILEINDVGNDQGREVRVVWKSSLYDAFASDTSVTFYSLWRRVDEFRGQTNDGRESDDRQQNTIRLLASEKLLQMENGEWPQRWANGELWDFVANISAERHDKYAFIAPTLADSTKDGIYWSVFYVAAHTQDPDLFFNSVLDSGYSVDNLEPSAPKGLIAERKNSVVELWWNRNLEEDFNYYAIYRSNQQGFNPDTIEALATTIDTTFSDHNVESTLTYYYQISAFDFSGNESKFSAEVCVLPTGVQEIQGRVMPMEFSLSQNYPNPFNPTTTIRYGIPRDVHVKLTIYDISGREITTLVHEQQSTGWYNVRWDGMNSKGQLVSTGVYLVHLKAGDFVDAKKILLMK